MVFFVSGDFCIYNCNSLMIDSILFLAVPLPPEPPPSSCCFYLAKARERLKGLLGVMHLPKSPKIGTWVGLKGLAKVMSLLVRVVLESLSMVMSLLVSPLLGVQVRLKGLSRVMPLLVHIFFFFYE